MALKVLTIFLLKLILINTIFLSSFCEAKSRPMSGGGGGGMKGGSKKPQNCYCETLTNLCIFQPGIDIRIANDDDKVLTCPPLHYQYCDIEYGHVKDRCGIRKIKNTGAAPLGFEQFGAYPWHVGIYINTKPETYEGSGVLITPHHILTTAHKVAKYSPSQIKFRLGEFNREVSGQCPVKDFKAIDIQIHPNFNPETLLNDVAVVQLQTVVPIADHPNINTACLATSVPKDGTRCFVAGWGKGHFGLDAFSSVLKEIDVPIVDHTSCEEKLKITRLGHGYKLNKDSFICAGGEFGKDACTGDGGAPLLCENGNGQFEVVGLVAWGINCGGSTPGIYVNVPNYRSWIMEQIYSSSYK